MNPAIIWFRRDLRLRDNPSLSWAKAQGLAVVALYIHSPEEEAPWSPGAASRWWLQQSLRSLSAQLAKAGIPLHCYRGPSAAVLETVLRETGSKIVLCNALPEPQLDARDRNLAQHLAASGFELLRFDEEGLHRPSELLNRQDRPYRVFTPFWRRLRAQLEATGGPASKAQDLPLAAARQPQGARHLAELELCSAHAWEAGLALYWQPGEDAAWQRLDEFLAKALAGYALQRDYPAQSGTSLLSPHLHFGEITAPQVLRALHPLLLEGDAVQAGAAEAFLRQLAWREFARHVLWHFPHTAQLPMDERFDEGFWHMDEARFRAWRQGRTGAAIVDAGMQQLWQSGWMHNRVRMLVASFLTKNLGLPWQAGARWFWDTLVDADLANNSLGWQWVAGCGVDAAPYYRIFNPQTQAARFDREGEYCRRWLGENEQGRPPLLVELKASREQALARYQTHIKRRSPR